MLINGLKVSSIQGVVDGTKHVVPDAMRITIILQNSNTFNI